MQLVLDAIRRCDVGVVVVGTVVEATAVMVTRVLVVVFFSCCSRRACTGNPRPGSHCTRHHAKKKTRGRRRWTVMWLAADACGQTEQETRRDLTHGVPLWTCRVRYRASCRQQARQCVRPSAVPLWTTTTRAADPLQRRWRGGQPDRYAHSTRAPCVQPRWYLLGLPYILHCCNEFERYLQLYYTQRLFLSDDFKFKFT